MRYFVTFLISLFPALPVVAQTPVKKGESDLVPITSGIVDQRDFADSVNGCGPASILNMLKFSREDYLNAYLGVLGSDEGVKMRFLVDSHVSGGETVDAKRDSKCRPLHGAQRVFERRRDS